jgi:hypothetical protein
MHGVIIADLIICRLILSRHVAVHKHILRYPPVKKNDEGICSQMSRIKATIASCICIINVCVIIHDGRIDRGIERGYRLLHSPTAHCDPPVWLFLESSSQNLNSVRKKRSSSRYYIKKETKTIISIEKIFEPWSSSLTDRH